MGWAEFAAAFAAFFASHSVPTRPAAREWIVSRAGRRGFTLGYSALSLAALAWLIAAAGRAPFVPLWPWAAWRSHAALAAMLVVCLVLALSLGRPNPFSFGGGRDEAFDPARPGLVRWMRHPLLMALAGWALAHVLANGDLAHVLMFGTFALFALGGRSLVDRRARRRLGSDWDALQGKIRASASLAPAFGKGEFALRAGVGVALYLVLIWLHPWLFGVAPLG